MLVKSLRMKNIKWLLSLFLIVAGFFASALCVAKPEKPTKEEELGIEAIEDPSKPIFVIVNKENWQPGPPNLPPGVQISVLEGNPNLPTTFTMRLKLPANYEMPAHWHPSEDRMTVISGQLMVGLGDKLEKNKKAKVLPAGSFVRIPAKVHHYTWTDRETVLQLTGHGPWHVHFVEEEQPANAADTSNKTSEPLHQQ